MVIGRYNVLSGGGQVDVDLLPGFDAVQITGREARGGQVEVRSQAANSITIVNSGQTPVRYIKLTWRVNVK